MMIIITRDDFYGLKPEINAFIHSFIILKNNDQDEHTTHALCRCRNTCGFFMYSARSGSCKLQ